MILRLLAPPRDPAAQFRGTERGQQQDQRQCRVDEAVFPTFGPDRQWSVPFYVDVGAGDSDLTWQGMVGLAYTMKSVDATAAWRYLDYDMGSRSPIRPINFSGPALGVSFRF
jgi:hypothetical protein